MKNILITALIAFIILNFYSSNTNAQTNVSGTINISTTWTRINSPYIVVDTVFVTSAAMLTIEPGVIIKFDSAVCLILNNATITALGNSTDSISFTSNSSSPTSNSWQGIISTSFSDHAIFNYCHFSFANYALAVLSGSIAGGYFSINNCYFNNNMNGIYNSDFSSIKLFIDKSTFQNNVSWGINLSTLIGYMSIKNSKIIANSGGIRLAGYSKMDNCIIDSNYNGVFLDSNYDTITNCKIKNNKNIGVEFWDYSQNSTLITNNEIENNKIGCQYKGPSSTSSTIFSCNKICNDITYDFDVLSPGPDINLSNNYWCTSDSSVIASHIHDGNDDPLLSFVNFIPFDTLECYLINSAPKNKMDNSFFEIFPNPVSDYLKLKTNVLNAPLDLKIFNVYGEVELYIAIKANIEIINTSFLSSGIHFLQLSDGDKIAIRKFFKL